ncbi:hypothetical protein AHMF7605_11560 [Adhaeribacter arboris]|uniref:Uncharacterized protein n=1 Tax=Adhaeribacter arboris TaxID=2072846 RepID=A0A2T2YF70_9BACT|nr:hypothetical protein [Adhaeribacter arboris]PSR54108.1 hypothetical protein AHMF7605_11560 [Adhaeribacter arboris]
MNEESKIVSLPNKNCSEVIQKKENNKFKIERFAKISDKKKTIPFTATSSLLARIPSAERFCQMK